MKSFLKKILKIWIIVCVGSFMQPAAYSLAENMIIEQGKADGLIGETISGYIDYLILDVPAALQREVSMVNLKRKAVYMEFAEKNQVSVDVAAALTAEGLIKRADEGHWVRDADGNWSQR